jgi:tryptophanyl-tRNA synthetase
MYDNSPSPTGKRILTGDRPTGPLHIGHLAGSLRARVDLQDTNHQTVLIADLQALTDNAGNPAKVRSNVREVVLDYLACGIDPEKTTIALQSGLPALSELTMLYMNLVSVPRLMRNPTIRSEMDGRGFQNSVPAGFLCYPVSQAADITAFDADLVPAGEDQLPLIEQTNEIVSAVNRIGGGEVLRPCKIRLSTAPRLPGSDGQGKMSKSAGNAIYLGDSPDDLRAKVMSMFTDPDHLKVSDPGRVEGNVVFSMLDAFDTDVDEVTRLKAHYREGGLGDMVLKRRLNDVLQAVLEPIREERLRISGDAGYIDSVIDRGTAAAVEVTDTVRRRVREAFQIYTPKEV